MKERGRKILLFLGISLFLELAVFNARALFSLGGANQVLDAVRVDDCFYISDMEGMPGWIYVEVEHCSESGEAMPVTFTLMLRDEGNFQFYELPEVTIYPPVEKSRYLRIHSYGQVEEICIVPAGASLGAEVTQIIYDARVPWFISLPRVLVIFVILCLAWCLRPGSPIYVHRWTVFQRRLAVGILLGSQVCFCFFLVRSNVPFLNPPWPYHQQYHQLAVALSEGKVSVDVGDEALKEALNALENPYDYALRMQTVEGADRVWDTCFYRGSFYVYFGIVPVLLFYLPYYLLFHGAFPTWLGVFLSGTGALCGVYYLLGQIRRRWFPESPYGWYLILSVIMGGSLNLSCAMLRPDFYYLPILLALCLSLWGMGLMLSAVSHFEGGGDGQVLSRLAGGALCLALTAGCRPQFLVGTFVMLPAVLPLFLKKEEKGRGLRLLAASLPYVLVAAGLMYYNFVRFGSVLDFGANYNLTTNDMTRRGWEWGRLTEGIFMYLFQPVNLRLSFPFAEVTPFYSDYLGETVKDWTFGGVFWSRMILLGLPGLVAARRGLRDKRAYGLAVTSLAMALVVVAADTEMAGILNRYCMDFLWLLMIPAVMVFFQLLEDWQGGGRYRWLLAFVLLAGTWGMVYELGMAFRGSELAVGNVHRYYMIQALFQ